MTNTTTVEEPEVLLKTDRLGRVQMPADKRELILDRFESSGLSGQGFAAQIGVKYTTFASWVQKRRRERGDYSNEACEPVKAPLTLVEAIVEEPAPKPQTASECSGSLEVQTASGLKLRVGNRAEIALSVELLKALKDAEL